MRRIIELPQDSKSQELNKNDIYWKIVYILLLLPQDYPSGLLFLSEYIDKKIRCNESRCEYE